MASAHLDAYMADLGSLVNRAQALRALLAARGKASKMMMLPKDRAGAVARATTRSKSFLGKAGTATCEPAPSEPPHGALIHASNWGDLGAARRRRRHQHPPRHLRVSQLQFDDRCHRLNCEEERRLPSLDRAFAASSRAMTTTRTSKSTCPNDPSLVLVVVVEQGRREEEVVASSEEGRWDGDVDGDDDPEAAPVDPPQQQQQQRGQSECEAEKGDSATHGDAIAKALDVPDRIVSTPPPPYALTLEAI